jgi:molybdate transport system ATP-binding protein
VLEIKIKKALPGFNLNVELSTQRELLTVLGPSGSGKTMTLKCIAGLIRPDEGYIRLNERVIFDTQKHIDLPPRQRKVGFVFQNYALFPHLTVKENIAYGAAKGNKGKLEDRINQWLEKMHLQGFGQRYPSQLSSGQQQRAALIRALFQEPEILLLDEPFSALDAHRKESLELELLNIKQTYNGDIIFVTHDVAQGYKLASRIAVFEAGHIIQCDTKQQVISNPINRTAARLTGLKNFIEGYISRIAGREIWVNIEGLAQPLRIDTKNATHDTVKQQVTIGIRPEYVRLTKGAGENTIPGVVERIVEGVASTDCYLKIKENDPKVDIEVRLSIPEAVNLATGQSCYLYLPPEYLVIINQD